VVFFTGSSFTATGVLAAFLAFVLTSAMASTLLVSFLGVDTTVDFTPFMLMISIC
jgi:hypothetical protein